MNGGEMNLISRSIAPAANMPIILLVEDELVVREITGEVLSRAGYTVLKSASPQEALHVASKHQGHIDLLLTDVVMPGMNGAELAHQLVSRQPDLIAVFMSGYAEQDVLRKMRMSEAIHIQKPFTVDILLTRVAAALKGGTEHPRELNRSSR